MMFRSILCATFCSLCLFLMIDTASAQQAFGHPQQQAFGHQWANSQAHAHEWQRFYHYPHVFYPHNFHPPSFYQSGPCMYNRYPAEMRVPAFNRQWVNFLPQQRRFHTGNHFRLDIF